MTVESRIVRLNRYVSVEAGKEQWARAKLARKRGRGWVETWEEWRGLRMVADTMGTKLAV